jgi:hypothetical protein
MTIDEYSGDTIDLGQVVDTAQLPNDTTKIWLQAELDARPNGSRDANFSYSLDGYGYIQLGGTYKMYTGWAFFLGYRFGIFNYATKNLGGSVKVESFTTA